MMKGKEMLAGGMSRGGKWGGAAGEAGLGEEGGVHHGRGGRRRASVRRLSRVV